MRMAAEALSDTKGGTKGVFSHPKSGNNEVHDQAQAASVGPGKRSNQNTDLRVEYCKR